MTSQTPSIAIRDRVIGAGRPAYIIAELSANHGQDFERAAEILRAAARAGADAVKIQLLRPETITLDCRKDCFRIGPGTAWEGEYLIDLYRKAATPWDWTPRLMDLAAKAGLDLFASVFDEDAVAFLEELGAPCYKIASFELGDHDLVRAVARTGKPLILSTGMAPAERIGQAVDAARAAGADRIALLKCTSAYPAPLAEMNLRTMADMSRRFNAPVGLSDHSLGLVAPVAAVSLGACIIEKHLMLSGGEPTPDSGFSLEPEAFGAMVRAVRDAEQCLGEVRYGAGEQESLSVPFARSLFAVEDVRQGQELTRRNVRSIRPGFGLPPSCLDQVLGRKAARDIPRGTPLAWDLLAPADSGREA